MDDKILQLEWMGKVGEIGACNGHIPIYCMEYKGEKNPIHDKIERQV